MGEEIGKKYGKRTETETDENEKRKRRRLQMKRKETCECRRAAVEMVKKNKKWRYEGKYGTTENF